MADVAFEGLGLALPDCVAEFELVLADDEIAEDLAGVAVEQFHMDVHVVGCIHLQD